MKVRKIKDITKYNKNKIESTIIVPTADTIPNGNGNDLYYVGKIIVDGNEVSLSHLNSSVDINNIETVRAGLEGEVTSNGNDNYIKNKDLDAVANDQLNIFLESTPSQQSMYEIMEYNGKASAIRQAKVDKIENLYSLMYDSNFLQPEPIDKLYTMGIGISGSTLPIDIVDDHIYIDPRPSFKLRAAENICEHAEAFAMMRGVHVPMRKIRTSSTACIFQYPEYLLGEYSNHILAIETIKVKSSVGLSNATLYSNATFKQRNKTFNDTELGILHAVDITVTENNE